MKKLLEASHAVVCPEGRTHDLFERELRKLARVPRVRLEIPHYLSLPTIIAASDLVATVHATLESRLLALRSCAFWSRRSKSTLRSSNTGTSAHRDPVNVWLRRTVNELFHD